MNAKRMTPRVLGLVVFAAALLTIGAAAGRRWGSARSELTMAVVNDAPYRDGVFQGMLDAERGEENRPSIGRWSRDEDRAHFVLGYERAFLQVLASQGDDSIEALGR